MSVVARQRRPLPSEQRAKPSHSRAAAARWSPAALMTTWRRAGSFGPLTHRDARARAEGGADGTATFDGVGGASRRRRCASVRRRRARSDSDASAARTRRDPAPSPPPSPMPPPRRRPWAVFSFSLSSLRGERDAFQAASHTPALPNGGGARFRRSFSRPARALNTAQRSSRHRHRDGSDAPACRRRRLRRLSAPKTSARRRLRRLRLRRRCSGRGPKTAKTAPKTTP